MKFVVTGAAGFIGSHLVDFLLAQEHLVYGIDNLSTGKKENLLSALENPRFHFSEENLNNLGYMRKIMKNADGIFHLAGSVGVINVSRNPLASFKNNLEGTVGIFEIAAELGVRTIFASSSEVYGKNQNHTLAEIDDCILGPIKDLRWHYALSKASGEALANSFFQEAGLKVSVCRLFNTAGPRQRHEFGMVIPSFIEAAVKNESLVIFGDGSQRRVFCHVSDVISALYAIWREESCIGETLNIGGESETTILDLAKSILTFTDSKSNLTFRTNRRIESVIYSDVQYRSPNTDKLRKSTNWAPHKTLDEILRDSIRFRLATC